ncbi:methyl-accepting chemotaxis protein [Siminovitchia terrae]|uniref:Methyl-accepting chemotaxis protein n=1 Tax=Siminovitchia terrae TaxID=1914933 RepID=A0A429X5J5_SIMTE|nr:methyl-accepting chemotaxis protein [Siminovitchia terrae]RST58708.1 methyl-accepting chemotaxis protein [Siminovitchia terrae]
MKLLNWFLNLKTATKLLSAFIFIALLQAGSGYFGLSSLDKVSDDVDLIYEKSLKPIEYMSQARNNFQVLSLKWRDINLIDSPNERAGLLMDVNTLRKEITYYFELYRDRPLNVNQERLLETYDKVWEEYNTKYDESVQQIVNGTGDYKAYMSGDFNNLQLQLVSIMNQLVELDMKRADKAKERADNVHATSTIITLSSVVITLVISVAFGVFISQIISRPLKRMVGLVEKVADGDLTETANINTRDEVGILAQSVNRMVINIKGMIQNILSAAENLSASSEQVSASTEEIASASANQANAAQTMNELFLELSEAINAVARNTEQAAELSNKTIQIAHDGEQVVLSSVEGANLVSDNISSLEEDSNKIGEIIGVIDDIADQTNLLALNAAIEAARAGDQGRGFAVVAEEVRKLAERSGEATKQITMIIKSMQENTAHSVKSVQDGLVYTKQSGEAFENIIQMINETGNKVTEIASASEEQAAQSEEVLSFIESISAATEEATASSQETALTSQSLIDLAEELNASVSAFKTS